MFSTRIRSNGRELCPDKMLSPRIESECEAGDGITFDFKHPECIHQNLKMKLIHRADCMATWTVKEYHFIILRPDSDRFQALCLRIRKPLNNIKHAYLFMDLVCDPGNTHGHPIHSGCLKSNVMPSPASHSLSILGLNILSGHNSRPLDLIRILYPPENGH
jgi:hypothetical protein